MKYLPIEELMRVCRDADKQAGPGEVGQVSTDHLRLLASVYGTPSRAPFRARAVGGTQPRTGSHDAQK